MVRTTLVSLCLMLVSATAFAEEPKPEVVHPKKTVIEFSDVHVAGEVARPDHVYIQSRNPTRFRVLIRVRSSFRPEIEASAEQL
jgi:hypothetical protein